MSIRCPPTEAGTAVNGENGYIYAKEPGLGDGSCSFAARAAVIFQAKRRPQGRHPLARVWATGGSLDNIRLIS